MSIERKVISALKWATAGKLVVQIVSWAGTLVVIRLLTPEAYGLMAKVAVVCAVAGTIAEMGLEASIVRSVAFAHRDLRKLYAVSLLFGAGVTAAIVVAAPLLSRLLEDPRLTWPIAVASLQIIIGATAVVPCALATRELSFRWLAKIEVGAGVIGILGTLVLAFLGAGVWALVLGTLLQATARSSALLALGVRLRPLFSFRGLAEHLKFGLTLAANRVSYIVVVQSDVLIGSAFLSTTEIGQYSVALQLATLPMAKVMGTINQVALPAVARQQGDLPRVRHAVLRAIGLISLAAFPALWGISAVAPELVQVLLGTKWLDAVPALTILPLIVPVRMICSVMFTASIALGNRQLDLRNTIANLLLIPAGFFVGAHWGLIGLCSAWLVSAPLAYSFSVPPVSRFMGIRASDLIRECGAPAAAAALMFATVFLLRSVLDSLPSALKLLALGTAGAFIYFFAMAVGSRRHLINARSFARSLFANDIPKIV